MAKKQNPVVAPVIAEETIAPVETTTVGETPAEATFVEEAPVEVKPTMKVGQRARQLILEGVEDNKGILAILQKEYPQGKTSMACIAWYKSDLKKTKVDADAGYKSWLKANELRLKAEYESSLVTA